MKDEATGAFFNAATVELTAYDEKDAEVPGQAWPLTMNSVAASSGQYQGVLSKDAQIVAGKKYEAVITADAGPGLFWKWRRPLHVRVRR